MKTGTWMQLGLMALACGNIGGAAAATAEYRLQENLDYNWPRQLISFEAAFEPGAGLDITSVTADGEPVHFQAPRAAVERHPDGSLAGARVYVLTGLGAGQTIVFRTHLDGERPELGPFDLQVSEADGRVTLETAAGAGVRLPLGQFSGEDIPAPYQGFKLTTGRWTGRSQLMGEPGPERLSAELTERGPVFAEVLLRYSYPEDRAYTLRCRVIAGETVALFTEEFDIEPGSRYHTYHRDQLVRFRQGRIGFNEQFRNSHHVKLTLDGFEPDLKALETYVDRQTHADMDVGDPWLATLHPFQSWHGGTHLLPLHNASEYLGLMPLRAGHWVRPYENLITVKRDAGEVYLEIPVNDGFRMWGVHFGAPSAAHPSSDSPGYPHFTNSSAFRRARIAYGETALDQVKDWVLAWTDAVPVPNPLLVFPPGDLEGAHERFRIIPEMAEIAAKTLDHWKRYWASKTEEDLGPPGYSGHQNFFPPRFDESALLYLTSGKAEHARHQFWMVRALLDHGIRQTLGGPGHTGWPYGHRYGVMLITGFVNGAAQMADPLLGSPFLTEDQKQALRARLAFYAYLLADRDFWPTNGIGRGNIDWHARHGGATGVLGSILAGHPEAQAWQQWGERAVEMTFSRYIHKDGVVAHGTHYGGVFLDYNIPFAALLRNAGGTNYFEDERFKRGLTYFAQICPPRDIRFGRAYMPPYGYSHPTDTSQSARWAIAALMTAESDRGFAVLMADTWRRQGQPLIVQEAGHFLAGMINPAELPGMRPERSSRRWEGFAVLRVHAETERETYMSICDWGGAPGENAGFHMYAKGVPMALTFGVRAYFDRAAWDSGLTQNRVLFDRRVEPRGTRRSGTPIWVSFPAVDLFGTQFRFTRLEGRAAVFEGDEEDPGNLQLSEPRPWPKGAPSRDEIIRGNQQSRFGETEVVPPQDWQRRVMLVKDEDPLGPNYFVIRDSLTGTLPTEWNLWVMSEALPEIEGQRARFRGKFDVDLDVYFAEQPRNIVTGAWGPGPGARQTWHRGDERQRLLQLQRDASEDYLVVLYPHTEGEEVPAFAAFGEGRGVRLDWSERTDHLVLNDAAVEVEADGFRFSGEAGLAQHGEGWTRLTLLVGDTIGLDDFRLTQHGAEAEVADSSDDNSISVTAVSTPDRRLVGEATGGPREVVIHVPVEYAELDELLIDGAPVALGPKGDGIYAFQMPPGDRMFEIRWSRTKTAEP